jgi:MYXO-CTERM domain-containing protein
MWVQMRFQLIALLCLAPAVSSAEPFSLVPYATGWKPNPAFRPLTTRLRGPTTQGTVQQIGEVVVLEGDDELITTSDMGGFGISVENGNPTAVTQRFYTRYDDVFDEIIVATTFNDEGAQATAYEISAQNEARGIGRKVFDQSAAWGSKNKKLFAFVNMMQWTQFGNAEQIASSNSGFYPVLAQEFAHRWLSFLRYTDVNGVVSLGMLGRDASHWASTLQAYGSVMDGNNFVDDGDGWYSLKGSNFTYSPLDLYGMGLVGKEEVPPFFLVRDAVTDKGRKVNPEQGLFGVVKIQGTREDITIDQVITAEGERSPQAANSAHDFRVAFVLVTRPGEPADSPSVMAGAAALERARKMWEVKFAQYTKGKGTMCTQVSAPCGSASARVAGGEVFEAGGNHNRVVDPGEPVFVHFNIWNDSTVPAKAITVKALGPVLAEGSAESSLPALAPASSESVQFYGVIPEDAACGQAITIQAEAKLDGNTFRGFTRVVPGLTGVFKDDFEATKGPFTVNKDGTDTATTNGWEYGTPVGYRSRGWQYQPPAGHSGSKAWFTGLQEGARGMLTSSLAPGKATLTMQPIDLSKSYLPEVKFYSWFQAIDYSNPMQGGETITDVALTLEASTDGGSTWTVLDENNTTDMQWQERRVSLDKIKSFDKPVSFRFVVNNPHKQGVDDRILFIEAGVDDFEITTLTQACNPNASNLDPAMPQLGGCACDVGGQSQVPGALMFALVPMLLLALRRRRA